MTRTLPIPLIAGIDTLLSGQCRIDLSARWKAISERYRAGYNSAGGIADIGSALAYVVARMPATYQALSLCCGEAFARVPSVKPKSLLDLGAGPGTASWAATAIWPSLNQVTLVDHNKVFIDVAKTLFATSGHGALENASMNRVDLLRGLTDIARHDVVAFAYSLIEIADANRRTILSDAWAATNQLMIVVEPGTPAGHASILRAREVLIELGASIVAPCPHQLDCPLKPPDWCHFSARVARHRDHMIVKSAHLPFEDEKFSYLIAAKPGLAVAGYHARVVARPVERKFETIFPLCTGLGTRDERRIKTRSPEFSVFRKKKWGDGVE